MTEHTVEFSEMVGKYLEILLLDYKHRNVPLIVEALSYNTLYASPSYRPVRYFLGSNFTFDICFEHNNFQVKVNQPETKNNNNITIILPSKDLRRYDFAWVTRGGIKCDPSLIIYISSESFLVKSYIRICPTDFQDASLTRTDFIC